MKLRRVIIAITIVTLMLLVFTGTVIAQESTEKQQVKEEQPNLIVVAGKETYKLAEGIIQFMESRGVPVLHLIASEFNGYQTDKEKPDYRKEEYIVILGGPNEPNGIGDIIKEVLTPEEVEWVSQPGNRKMYIKGDVWRKGQNLIIFAGSNKEAVKSAMVNTKDNWWVIISNWFDVEIEFEIIWGY